MHIIPNQGVSDPHIHIFNGKAYLFSGHDYGPGQPFYRMEDWRIFSSDDLLNWKLEYVVKPEDTYLKECHDCWAGDAAERNGKFYFYFSDEQRSTGVLVSENGPAGPYVDVLKKPLLPKGLVDTACYDPAVFIDDDENKTPYILFGYTVFDKQYYIARLNDDMISLAEDPKPIELIDGWKNDAICLTKHNGLYYLNSHGGAYGTSGHIYGPYTRRPKFCSDAYVDHANFFTFHNQTYLTYGVPNNWGEENVDRFYRTTKIIYAHYKDNGDITVDEFIQDAGVGQYDAEWESIKGEWFFAASDGIEKKENSDGFEIRGIRNNSYLYFQNVRHMRQNAIINFYVSNGNTEESRIEIREDSPFGKILGCCKVESTGGFDQYQNIRCKLENTYGSHNLCFVFKSEAEEALRFEQFSFEY